MVLPGYLPPSAPTDARSKLDPSTFRLVQTEEVEVFLDSGHEHAVECPLGREGGVKTEVLTVKVSSEVMADLEQFAAKNFPALCPKCKGRIVLMDGTTCPLCRGVAPGNKSEAVRFLLHHALGQAESPEVRALVAAYSEARAKFFKVIMSTAHRMELTFHDEVITAVRAIQTAPRRRK